MTIKNAANSIQYPLQKDLMFALVMSDPELCKSLLERIFPSKKIRNLQLCEGSNSSVQRAIFTGIISKNIRLDVLFENDDTWYALEMQTIEDSNLPMRGRYYGSAMDIDQIKQGARYSELSPNYVIFICTFDYYKLGQAIYSFQNYDFKNSLPYGDKSYKIIVNTTSQKKDTPTELVAFFDYINSMKVPENDTFIQALHTRVESFNTSEWRRRLMTLEEQIRLDQEKAFAEGETEGEVRKNLENAKRMKDEGLELSLISKITELPVADIKNL